MYFPIFRANLAVMSYMRAAHLSAQQRIELRQLRAHWSRYGLRERDLELSVARLESLGFIDVDRTHGHQYLVLTEMGQRSAYSVIGLIESLALMPRRLGHLLGRLKFWSQGDGRRAGDRRESAVRAPRAVRTPRGSHASAAVRKRSAPAAKDPR